MAKEGKKALVPKLRFPEFRTRSGWESTPLGEASTQVTERVGERKLTPVSISAGVGFVPQAEKFGRDISGNQYSLYTLVRDGDFVYNKGNSLKFPQGCVYQLRGWGEVAAPNVFISFRLKQGYVAEYFQYCFEKNIHGAQLKKHITSGARSNGLLNVSKDQFYGISIPMPLPDEQQKIADSLSSLDELIAAQGRKVEALKTYKRGLMQQLFPREGETLPRLRFPEFRDAPEWKEVKAGMLFANRTERGDDSLPIYSVTMTDGLVRRTSLDRRIDDLAEAKGNKKAYRHDIAYNMMRMWQGACGVASDDCMVSPAYVVLSPQSSVHSQFYGYLFKLPQMLWLFTSHSRGLTEDRLRLYYPDFSSIPMPQPDETEQRLIAECLSALDTRIATECRRLAEFKSHKKGLMQQLFPLVEEA